MGGGGEVLGEAPPVSARVERLPSSSPSPAPARAGRGAIIPRKKLAYVTTATGAARRRKPRSIMIVSPASRRSLEPSPVPIVEDDLDVLDGVEIHAGSIPDSQHEVAIERPALQLEPQVIFDEHLVCIRQGIRDVALRREPSCVFDATGEELRLEILPLVVSNQIRAVVDQGIGDEPRSITGRREHRIRAVVDARADEIDPDRVDPVVEVASCKTGVADDFASFDITLVDVERRLPKAE